MVFQPTSLFVGKPLVDDRGHFVLVFSSRKKEKRVTSQILWCTEKQKHLSFLAELYFVLTMEPLGKLFKFCFTGAKF